MSEQFTSLIERAREHIITQIVPLKAGVPSFVLFASLTDGKRRAVTVHASAANFKDCWKALVEQANRSVFQSRMQVRWLRVEWVDRVDPMSFSSLRFQVESTKRNYFRYGIALDRQFRQALLETEINANALLYGGGDSVNGIINIGNFNRYLKIRHGVEALNVKDTDTVYRFTTRGIFLTANESVIEKIVGTELDTGRRIRNPMTVSDIDYLIENSSIYLASQVKGDGRFVYGWHPCFDREIHAYNALRHASSLYSMIEAYEVTRQTELHQAIERALAYLVNNLIKTLEYEEQELAVLVDTFDEVKLGGNAVCLLALIKYSEVHQTSRYNELLERLALAICIMQDRTTGRFNHVLNYPALDVKERFRIIYYDGEAAFGLMRLYALTKDARWLEAVERGFEHFIASDHWKAHDHWLSYAVNELTRYRPEIRYYEFGIKNFATYLDFVKERITTFPTLLELMMAAQQMLERMAQDESVSPLLATLDLAKFYSALETRAHYLLNGYFWPELAMFFANPDRIAGSFFIRHHAFRVRIDDVEHYLSGFIAYKKYRLKQQNSQGDTPLERGATPNLEEDYEPSGPTVLWGGDVNLGRRQHYVTADLGPARVLDAPCLHQADLRIVNLECVVTTLAEQGVDKGEGGPYYYRARPEMLRILTEARIDVVATANNHSGDYGPEALLEQANLLNAVGICSVGSGLDEASAFQPGIKQVGHLRVAIFSIDATQSRFAAKNDRAGAAYLPLGEPDLWFTTLEPRIAAARTQAHIVLVAVHWGDNMRSEPCLEELAVGHRIIDAGADAILGASAHLLQGIEIYKGRPIIHDAGDLLFDAIRGVPASTGVFTLELSPDGVKTIIFTPMAGGFGFTREREGREALKASQEFARACAKFDAKMDLTSSGKGILHLTPPKRQMPITVYDEPTPCETSPVPPSTLLNYELGPQWICDEVPADARITPLQIGPLTLLGVRVAPKEFTRRCMLWVETYWETKTPLSDDMRINILASPRGDSAMRPWGWGMDHDPCDWLA
ncbi:MAG: CapA family protein, partial [Brucella intermedia]